MLIREQKQAVFIATLPGLAFRSSQEGFIVAVVIPEQADKKWRKEADCSGKAIGINQFSTTGIKPILQVGKWRQQTQNEIQAKQRRIAD